MSILYINDTFLTDWNEFKNLAVRTLTSQSSNSKGLQDEVMASFRDGTLYDWASIHGMAISTQLNPEFFIQLNDGELKSAILKIFNQTNSIITSLPFDEFCEVYDWHIIENNGETNSVDLTDESRIPASPKSISLGIKVKKPANDVIKITIQSMRKSGETHTSSEIIISLRNRKVHYETIPIPSGVESILLLHNGKIVKTITMFPYDVVDMGTSVYWRECNLGANTPDESGLYFQWGSLEGTEQCSPKDYYYLRINDISNCQNYDAALRLLGVGYRIPTLNEWEELIVNCSIKMIWNKRGAYIKLISRSTKNVLRIPCIGHIQYKDIWGGHDIAHYWSSNAFAEKSAYALECHYSEEASELAKFIATARWLALPIRPVYDCTITEPIPYIAKSKINRDNVWIEVIERCLPFHKDVFGDDKIADTGLDIEKLNKILVGFYKVKPIEKDYNGSINDLKTDILNRLGR